jgi:hypothetical protein
MSAWVVHYRKAKANVLRERRKAMKKLMLQAALMFGVTGSALAAGGVGSTGGGLMIALVLGFVAVIIVFQAIPSLILFFCVVRELVSGRPAKAASITGQEKVG